MQRRGRVELVFARGPSGETFLSRQYASYPYHIGRRLRFPDDPTGMASLYLQSSAGGIFEHDDLSERLTVEARAQGHVATQASTIVHGMTEGNARLETHVSLDENSYFELLPDPLILFPGARLSTRRRIRLASGALGIFGESFLAHDPKGGGRPFGCFEGETLIEGSSGETLAVEKFRVSGRDFASGHVGSAGAYRAMGSLLVLCPERSSADVVGILRASLDPQREIYGGASVLPSEAGACAKVLAKDGAALKAAMHAMWAALRLHLVGRAPRPRRK